MKFSVFSATSILRNQTIFFFQIDVDDRDARDTSTLVYPKTVQRHVLSTRKMKNQALLRQTVCTLYKGSIALQKRPRFEDLGMRPTKMQPYEKNLQPLSVNSYNHVYNTPTQEESSTLSIIIKNEINELEKQQLLRILWDY